MHKLFESKFEFVCNLNHFKAFLVNLAPEIQLIKMTIKSN